GEELRSYPLEGFGWSVVALSASEDYAYVGNWFTGQLGKLSMESGRFEAMTDVCEKCMAGIAVYTGAKQAD
ncbi:MAG: hypothetical protein ACN4GT_13680, partial [Gammaproteobacteria bacterium]